MIELKITAADPVDLAHQIFILYMQMVDAKLAPPLDGEAPTGEEVPAASPAPAAATRKRRTQAEIAADKAATDALAAKPEVGDDELPKDDATVGEEAAPVTFDELRETLRTLTVTCGFDIASGVVGDLGVGQIKQLPVERYDEAKVAFQKAIDEFKAANPAKEAA